METGMVEGGELRVERGQYEAEMEENIESS